MAVIKREQPRRTRSGGSRPTRPGVRAAEARPEFRNIKEQGTERITDLGTYEYAGFQYRVTRVVPRPEAKAYLFLQTEKGQHPAAYKEKHLQAALQCYMEDHDAVQG